jgi:hypothetical protein
MVSNNHLVEFETNAKRVPRCAPFDLMREELITKEVGFASHQIFEMKNCVENWFIGL